MSDFKAVPCTPAALHDAKTSIHKKFKDKYCLSSLDIETFPIKLEGKDEAQVLKL